MKPAVALVNLLEELGGHGTSVIDLVRAGQPIMPWRQIERLQEEKMERLVRYRVAHPGRDVFEDRSLEILSRVEIDMRAAATNGNATISCGAGGEGRA